jgi:predicted S18 family serine protease
MAENEREYRQKYSEEFKKIGNSEKILQKAKLQMIANISAVAKEYAELIDTKAFRLKNVLDSRNYGDEGLKSLEEISDLRVEGKELSKFFDEAGSFIELEVEGVIHVNTPSRGDHTTESPPRK